MRAYPVRMSSSDEYLPLSGIQHFAFCRRQWALIHVEQQWKENQLTAEGRIQHETAHDETRGESRGDLLISRGMRVISHTLRLQGTCDVVEFRRDPQGISLKGKEGLWRPMPIEYKHGMRGIGTEADALQLCCQAICLEEMLLCAIPVGAVFYHSTRRREVIAFDEPLRERVLHMAEEMNEYFARGYTPRVKRKAGCKSCSLIDVCLPKMLQGSGAASYVRQAIEEVNPP